MNKQVIFKTGTFDAGHRVMNEKMKCFNLHGHTYRFELYMQGTLKSIGYAIDFKEVKRVALQWIDDYLDHGMILNPKDVDIIKTCAKVHSKLWVLSLNGTDYCNPTVENVAKELFICLDYMMHHWNIEVVKVVLWETPSCGTVVEKNTATKKEIINCLLANKPTIKNFVQAKGFVEYDDRVK